MSKMKKLLLILTCLFLSFEVESESNNLDDEDLYVIIVELEHNNKIRFLSGTQLADVAEVRAFAATLTRATPRVIVAMGAAGSVMASADGSAWHAAGADVPVVSKVGAGDSFVGGFALALARGAPPEQALQSGMAAASAAVMTAGTELCRLEDYDRVLPDCTLTRL